MNETNNNVKPHVPPYLSFNTFLTFLGSVRDSLPSRIDRSVMPSFSGAVQSQLLAALEYLHLIDSTGAPTGLLAELVESEGKQRQQLLEETLKKAYTFLFEDDVFELTRISSAQLKERFSEAGTSGDTTRKAISFFVRAANMAEIPLSPHIKKPRGPRPGGSKRKPRESGSKRKNIPNGSVHTANPPMRKETSLEKILLEKFPSFDPNWPDEIKSKWFDDFKDLMAHVKESSDKE